MTAPGSNRVSYFKVKFEIGVILERSNKLHFEKCHHLKKNCTCFVCLICFFFWVCLDKLTQGGADTINYQDHQYCQMGVGISYIKVRQSDNNHW